MDVVLETEFHRQLRAANEEQRGAVVDAGACARPFGGPQAAGDTVHGALQSEARTLLDVGREWAGTGGGGERP